MTKKMAHKHKLFVLEYIKDYNGLRAYKKVYGCSDSTAKRNASRLLTNAHVQVELAKLTEKIEKRVEEDTAITKEMVLTHLRRVMTTPLPDLFKRKLGNDGKMHVSLKEFEEMTQAEKACIKEWTVNRQGVHIKTKDCIKAAELLGRHLGLFPNDHRVEANVNITPPQDPATIHSELGKQLENFAPEGDDEKPL